MLQRLLPWLGALGLSLTLATPAAAQDDPQVDPDSPAGTEYQLPTDRAREQANGGDGSSGGGSSGSSRSADKAALFGAGVGRSASASPGRHAGGGAGTRTTGSKDQPDSAPSSTNAVTAQAPDGGGNGSPLVTIGAGAAGVLLTGSLAGLGWRRRSMRR